MSMRRVMVVALLSSLAGTAWAAGGGGGGGAKPAPSKSPEVSKAEKLIKDKKWDEAVQVLQAAAETDGSNADVFNWMGYAERNRGNTDAAFADYEKALRLDPKHLGAHEYVGETYLIVGNVEKAKEHLGALRDLCGTRCKEYKDLAKDIQEYQEKHT
jgi:tetratricopeptide (TPR) repeat protein